MQATGIGPTGKVSPPTRGWTMKVAVARSKEVGFPAHAGMDPRRGIRRLTGAQGFPAHAGMDPGQTSGCGIIAWIAGFPAHAGMDPIHV